MLTKIGDYVHAHRWSDQDPNDPWCVGHVSEIGDNYVVVGLYSERRWSRWENITGEEGRQLLIDRGVLTKEV